MIELKATSPEELERAIDEIYQNVIEDFQTIDYAPYLMGEFKHFEALHTGYWASESGPDGVPWPPLAPSTVKRKGHAKILIEKDKLRKSLTQNADHAVREVITDGPQPASVFGTTIPYSAAHDKQVGNRPARRHVGMNAEHLDKMVNRVADFVMEELKNA